MVTRLVRERAFALALGSALGLLLLGRDPLEGHAPGGWMAVLFAGLVATTVVSAFAVVRHAEALAHAERVRAHARVQLL